MKLCVNCGHAVSQGDRHARMSCPPRPGARGDGRKAKERRRRRKNNDDVPQRGMPVTGTGKPKGASGGKG